MTVKAKMASSSGIEVRRSNPSVATIWVAELLAAANRHTDEIENKKTHESIQQMFGKINATPSKLKLSVEQVLSNKITKQKKKSTEKEKEYQMSLKSKKKKKVLTNGLSKTEYISEKQKTSTPGSQRKSAPSIENIRSRLEDQSISRSARKKLKRKLKELQSLRETEPKATSVQEKEKIHLLQNKNKSKPSVQKKLLNLTNGHQSDTSANFTNGHHLEISAGLTNGYHPEISTGLTNGHQLDTSASLTNGHHPDISTSLTNGHQECQSNTITNGFKKTNKRKETQPDGDDLQPPKKKSKLAKKLKLIAELLKKQKKKKRSKQKNIKKDNRPDNMKPPHLQQMKATEN